MRRCSFVILILAVALVAEAKPIRPEKKDDRPTLDGVWDCVSVAYEGAPAPAEQVKGMQLKIAGKKILVNTAQNEKKEATIAVDFEKRPIELDLMPEDGPEKGMKIQFILKIEGDNLTMCASKPGNPRPTEFKGGMDRALMVLKRAK